MKPKQPRRVTFGPGELWTSEQGPYGTALSMTSIPKKEGQCTPGMELKIPYWGYEVPVKITIEEDRQ